MKDLEIYELNDFLSVSKCENKLHIVSHPNSFNLYIDVHVAKKLAKLINSIKDFED